MRRILIGAAAAVVVVALAGCSSTTSPPPQEPTATPVAHVTSCPADAPVAETTPPSTPAPTPAAPPLPGASRHMVPFTPSGALVCSYDIRATGGRGLVASRSVTASAAQRLAKALNSAGRRFTGPVSCPADFGGSVVIHLWSSTEMITVTLDTSGCSAGRNGARLLLFVNSGAVRSQLHTLVGTRE